MGLDVLGFLKADKEDPEEGYASLLAWRLWDDGADTHNVSVHGHNLSWEDSRVLFKRGSGSKCNCPFGTES